MNREGPAVDDLEPNQALSKSGSGILNPSEILLIYAAYAFLPRLRIVPSPYSPVSKPKHKSISLLSLTSIDELFEGWESDTLKEQNTFYRSPMIAPKSLKNMVILNSFLGSVAVQNPLP